MGRWINGIAAGLTCVILAGSAHAENIGGVDGLWVMKKVEDRYEGDDRQEDLLLTLQSFGRKNPSPITMDVKWMEKDYGSSEKVIIHFLTPKFAKGITLFTEIRPYKDDDRWLYVPDANVIRRVHAKDEFTNFMGTDFTYFDLSEREPDEELHELLRIEQLGESTCYVVETRPKQMLFGGYSKRITWVDKDRFIKLRIQYFSMGGEFYKQYDTSDWREIQGIWTPMRLLMKDTNRQHMTTIVRSNVRYNLNPADEFFEPASVDRFVFEGDSVSLLPFEERPTRIWEKIRKIERQGAPAKGE